MADPARVLEDALTLSTDDRARIAPELEDWEIVRARLEAASRP